MMKSQASFPALGVFVNNPVLQVLREFVPGVTVGNCRAAAACCAGWRPDQAARP